MGAKILDWAILAVVMVILSLISRNGSRMMNQSPTGRTMVPTFAIVMMTITFTLPFCYNFLMLAKGGATIGKKVCGIEVLRANFQPLGYRWAFWRSLAEWIFVALGYGLGLVAFMATMGAQMHHSGPHRASLFGSLFSLMFFLLVFLPYLPAFFTNGRRTLHDLLAQTFVVNFDSKK